MISNKANFDYMIMRVDTLANADAPPGSGKACRALIELPAAPPGVLRSTPCYEVVNSAH
jgi:hypothetical protein